MSAIFQVVMIPPADPTLATAVPLGEHESAGGNNLDRCYPTRLAPSNRDGHALW